ncbi:MAG: hypothetical protein ACTSXV_00155, partial [Alphaproteobacteria bacterium]
SKYCFRFDIISIVKFCIFLLESSSRANSIFVESLQFNVESSNIAEILSFSSYFPHILKPTFGEYKNC